MAIQIPVLSIKEEDGVFTFEGPNGLSVSMDANSLDAESKSLLSDPYIALAIARCRWWVGRPQAEDKAAYDAMHCCTVTWNPAQENAVTYGD